MRSLLLVVAILSLCTAARAERHVTRTKSVVVTTTAQDDACYMARTGIFGHRGTCGCREGIGFSAASADDAVQRCCYWGKYRVREIGVARGNRGWYACVRYE